MNESATILNPSCCSACCRLSQLIRSASSLDRPQLEELASSFDADCYSFLLQNADGVSDTADLILDDAFKAIALSAFPACTWRQEAVRCALLSIGYRIAWAKELPEKAFWAPYFAAWQRVTGEDLRALCRNH